MFRKELVIEHPFALVAIVFFFALQTNFFYAGMIYWRYNIDLFTKLIISSLYTAAVSPLLLIFFKKVQLVRPCKRLSHKE
jgi:hypothetical protein